MDATLIGFGLNDFLGLASSLTVPAWGFIALYLLALPLRGLPGVAHETEYSPPKWLLPLLTSLLVATLFASLGVAAALKYKTATPEPDIFLAQFQQPDASDIRLEPPLPNGAVKWLLQIDDFQEYSYLRVFLNNRRLFGSHADCLVVGQCGRDRVRMWGNERPGGMAERDVGLPLQIDLTPHLVTGANELHISSDNAGVESCRATISLIRSDPAAGNATEPIWTASVADGKPTSLERYRTKYVYPEYRVCERLAVRLIR